MKIETVEQRILTADEGKYLTNGKTAGKTVVLPSNEDFSDWVEITQQEYDRLQAEQTAELVE